ADRLGEAVVRLYERYAELLPDGPGRTRAAATARSIAATNGSLDLDRMSGAWASGIETVDHRVLGTWSARGAEAYRRNLGAVLDLADGIVLRDDDVLCLTPDALLMQRTHFGTERAGGGVYERPFLMLRVFGRDGLINRIEFFDPDCDAEALARF